MISDNFLTKRWNNILSLSFGLPTIVYAIIVLSTSVLSGFAGFLGMILLGAIF